MPVAQQVPGSASRARPATARRPDWSPPALTTHKVTFHLWLLALIGHAVPHFAEALHLTGSAVPSPWSCPGTLAATRRITRTSKGPEATLRDAPRRRGHIPRQRRQEAAMIESGALDGGRRSRRLRSSGLNPARSESPVNSQEPFNPRITDPARLPLAYADALNAGDADAVLALFHQEATMRTFNGAVLTDRESLHAETLASIAAQARLTNEPRSVLIVGDTALLIVDWKLEAKLPDGTRISPAGTTTAVARRATDASWRFAVLHCQGTAGSPGWQTTELPTDER